MRRQIDLWTVVFLFAVLLQDSLLAIVNAKDATTKKQTISSHKGNYCSCLTSKEVKSNLIKKLISLSFSFAKI